MKLLIFGENDFARMSEFYFRRDTDYEILGFFADKPQNKSIHGLPVVDLGTAITYQQKYKDYLRIFAPLNDNRQRKAVYQRLRNHCFKFTSYISPRSEIWSYAAIGENCFIQEMNNLQFEATVGDNCVIWAGNHIGHHSIVGSHSFIASHVVISGRCSISELAYLGVNCCIKESLSIHSGAIVGMGSVVTKTVPANTLVFGNPAKPLKKLEPHTGD